MTRASDFAPTIASNGSDHRQSGRRRTRSTACRSPRQHGVVTNFGAPSFASSTGEGIIPGTKQEYEDEYVIGVEQNIKQSMVFKARYTDRRLGRIIEDIGSQSPEGSTIVPNYNGGITNPGPSTDIAVNEQEVTYTPAQFNAANPGQS